MKGTASVGLMGMVGLTEQLCWWLLALLGPVSLLLSVYQQTVIMSMQSDIALFIQATASDSTPHNRVQPAQNANAGDTQVHTAN